ncbi:hypothetical protein PS723_02765 [Pseudomonas fluorescens]|uniref:Uncharacterized protein n=1 Tax=Pseudomonas fluorescens TaxID=294 RepID=A0A5E7CCU6_PSEFL|nr:hypothetical protein PS723_02765 [Pseudomonas fluorescens]
MAIFEYTAYAKDHTHKTVYGEVVANTFKEAETKIKTLYSYPIETKLSLILDEPIKIRKPAYPSSSASRQRRPIARE